MKDQNHKSQSVLFRTTLSLAVGTILVFLVLIMIFYKTTTSSIISDNKDKMKTQAESLVLAYDSLITDKSVSETAALNPDWVEWLMGFPRKWTDVSSGPPSRKESPALLKTPQTAPSG